MTRSTPTSLLLLVASLLLLLGACIDDSPADGDASNDSESHWLSSCTDDAQCDAGLTCICGLCTTPCTNDDACADSGDARCAIGPIGCAEGGFCTGDCTEDADCTVHNADLVCQFGGCVVSGANNNPNNNPNNNTNNSNNNPNNNTNNSGDVCDELTPQIIEAVSELASCTRDADCAVTHAPICNSDVMLGCEMAIRDGADRTTFDALVDQWADNQCPNADCDCQPATGAACIANTCTLLFDGEDEQTTCEATGGRWDEGSCGHWQCGLPPLCDAIVPGCDCGGDMTFVPGVGCRLDPACVNSEPALCRATGGEWQDRSCGHWGCGLPPDCDADIPGCNCGADANFDPIQGCVVDDTCATSDRDLCEGSGGQWDPQGCGHTFCGTSDACIGDGGCICADVESFVEGRGCRLNTGCEGADVALCEQTGGTWDMTACGHYSCGSPNACQAVIPGCDCGATANFDPERGCAYDFACVNTSGTFTVDPDSITIFDLPINSVRYAASGYIPAIRTCITVVWDYSNNGFLEGAHCDDFDPERGFPYAIVVPDTDGPCGQWDYAPNAEITRVAGCFEPGGFPTTSGLVDVQIDLTGDLLAGQVVMSNRGLLDPQPTHFGINYTTDIPETVYVQSVAADGNPAWVSVRRAGSDEPVGIFPRCDLPLCGTDDGVCGLSFSEVLPFTENAYSGAIALRWDGLVNVSNANDTCYTREPAEPGDYIARLCFGWAFESTGEGDIIPPASLQCTEIPFTWPTDRVIWRADFGG